MPILISLFYTWSFNLNMREQIDSSAFYVIAFTLQWFSLFDCMDGMRARRLKCGTPLGRIIDEALDQVSYACVGNAIGYMLRLDSPIWYLSFTLVNVPFYSMEIRHTIMRNFNMIIGEIGPIELELIYTIIFLLSAIYGVDVYDRTLADMTGLDYEFMRNA